LDGFSQVVGFNYIGTLQVGNSASEFEDAMEGSGGEQKLLHCCLKETLRCRLRLTELTNLDRSHIGIAGEFGAIKALPLDRACGFNSGSDFL